MENYIQSKMFVTLCCLLLTGCSIGASDSSYDYSASIDCVSEPPVPQYNGGMVGNPNFDSGVAGWGVFGSGKIQARKSRTGNNYLAALDRKLPNDSFSQAFDLQKDWLYTFSAWLQINEGKGIVSGFLEIPGEKKLIVGSVIATSGCWSMLKGGFTADKNTTVQLYFASRDTKAEIWIDSVSLKGFTRAEWQEHRDYKIEQVRKRRIKIHVTKKGKNLQGANITISQTRTDFVIGCGSTEKILDNKAYQDWFLSRRFQATTFGNEMKWYFTEIRSLIENYTIPDAMVSYFKKNGIGVRGHNILWANKNMTPRWTRPMFPRQFLNAAIRHIGSVVSRYSRDVIAWDVMNENLHFSFFEEKLGPNASAMFYQIVRALTPEIPLFLNEYGTLEYPLDRDVIPSRYVERIREIQSFPGNENLNLRIGLEGHFQLRPNVSYIRSALDVLGATRIPIWLTELDTKRGPNQAAELEDVMREAFSHPSVEGIIVWGHWKPTACNKRCLTDKNYNVLPKGCVEMCLVDNYFKNLPPGDVLDKLLEEWRTPKLTAVTNKDGVFKQTVFLGEYSVAYAHPKISHPGKRIINVTKGEGPLEVWIDL